MANSLNDGLSKPDQVDTGGITAAEIGSGGILAANISGGQINKTHLSSGCVLAANLSGGQVGMSHLATNQMSAGSPAAGGLFEWSTTGSTTTGSKLTVTFGKAFLAAPTVMVSPYAGNVGYVSVGSVTTTTCEVLTETASTFFSLSARGSGTI